MNIHHMSLAVIFPKTFADLLDRLSVLLLDIADLVVVEPLLALDSTLTRNLFFKLFGDTKHALDGTLPFNMLRSVYSHLNSLFIGPGSVFRKSVKPFFISFQPVFYG